MERMTIAERIRLLKLLNMYQETEVKPNIKDMPETQTELAVSIMAANHNKVIEEIKECICLGF